MKGKRTDLKSDSDKDKEKPNQKTDRHFLLDLGDLPEQNGIGVAIDKANPKRNQRRGQYPQDKKFNSRLTRFCVVSQIGNQNVESKRGKFQRDKKGKKVVGGDHEHHPQCREKNQVVIFALEMGQPINIVQRGEEDQNR